MYKLIHEEVKQQHYSQNVMCAELLRRQVGYLCPAPPPPVFAPPLPLLPPPRPPVSDMFRLEIIDK